MTTPRILSLHMHGDDVGDAQRALIQAGYGALLGPQQDDTNFGRRTRRAVRKFQSDHGLPATGILDAQTLDLLHTASHSTGATNSHTYAPAAPHPFAHLPGVADIPALPHVSGTRPVIVIDPGHGDFITQHAIAVLGKQAGDVVTDTGAIVDAHGRMIQEKDVNLAISLRLRDALVKRGFAVELTRSTEHDVLATRYDARIATGQQDKKVLHLSVHADASAATASGLTIYTHHSFRHDASSASVQFAKALSDHGRPLGHSERTAMLNPRLMGDVPAALAEVGNLNNPADLERLTTPHGQQQIADHLADRIARYYTGSMLTANATLPPLGGGASTTQTAALGQLPAPAGARTGGLTQTETGL